MKLNYSSLLSVSVMVTVAALWQASAYAQPDTKDPQFELTIYSDVTGAEAMLEQNYPLAITQMTSDYSDNRILIQNNLCAAYILQGQLGRANEACANALVESERSDNYGGWLERTHSTRTRKLYKNRAQAHLRVLRAEEARQLAATTSEN
ncbi:MAG: hypothetical protein AB8B86_11685 [Pseudomonadales bacterium]